ncbi:MAG TPA: hypothetical protein VF221_13935, partial [Chloroflexota bacterium]
NAGAGGVVVQGVFDSPSEAERNRLWPETAGRSWPGLLTQEGVLTEVGLGWVRALNERLDVIRPSLPDIDPRARERDPELLMREAFDAFTR